MTGSRPDLAIRFVVVAALCALVHNLIVIGFDAAGIHYVWSNAVSYLVCVTLGYGLHAAWTYAQPLSLAAFARYALPMLLNYPASVALLFVLADIAHLPMVIAVPLATVGMLAWNFATTRWALFRRPAVLNSREA